MLTGKSRVARALAHEDTDICPYDLGFSRELRERLVEFTGDAQSDRELVPHLGSVSIGYPETGERIDERHYTDAFGVVWEESVPGEIGMVREPILKEPTLRRYEFPPAHTTSDCSFPAVPDSPRSILSDWSHGRSTRTGRRG